MTSARSTTYHAANLWYVFRDGHRGAAGWIVIGITKAGHRHLLFYPALMSLGGVALGSCASEPVHPPPQTSAARPMPSGQPEVSAPPRSTPRPARKPSAPSPVEGTAPGAEDGALAMNAPKPLAGPPGLEASPPPPGPADVPTSASPAASPLPQTSELIGLDQPTATRLFGAAVERSDEPPATVWRYKNATCELDLFFYLDLRSGRMRTLHYAFKGDSADTVRRQNCLRSLLVARGD